MSSCPNCPKNNSGKAKKKDSLVDIYACCCVAKFSDFAKLTNDFFGKEFPAGQVRVEVKSTAKPSTGVKNTFTDVLN